MTAVDKLLIINNIITLYSSLCWVKIHLIVVALIVPSAVEAGAKQGIPTRRNRIISVLFFTAESCDNLTAFYLLPGSTGASSTGVRDSCPMPSSGFFPALRLVSTFAIVPSFGFKPATFCIVANALSF